jgi:hypothetical protein
VLELDWSGPEPSTTDDLGVVEPLRLTHHSWKGQLSHANCDWVLPRSYRVLGRLPLVHDQRSNSYTSRWRWVTNLPDNACGTGANMTGKKQARSN